MYPQFESTYTIQVEYSGIRVSPQIESTYTIQVEYSGFRVSPQFESTYTIQVEYSGSGQPLTLYTMRIMEVFYLMMH